MGGTLHSYCNKNPEVDRHIKTQKVLSKVFFFERNCQCNIDMHDTYDFLKYFWLACDNTGMIIMVMILMMIW